MPRLFFCYKKKKLRFWGFWYFFVVSETRVAFQSTYIFNSNVVVNWLLRLINRAYVLLRKPATLVASSVDSWIMESYIWHYLIVLHE